LSFQSLSWVLQIEGFDGQSADVLHPAATAIIFAAAPDNFVSKVAYGLECLDKHRRRVMDSSHGQMALSDLWKLVAAVGYMTTSVTDQEKQCLWRWFSQGETSALA
jgi:hypothetical protein